MADQHGALEAEGGDQSQGVIGGLAQAVVAWRGLDALAVPAHIQGVDPVALCQRRADAHPAQSRTRDAVQQEGTGELRPLCAPTEIVKATGGQVNGVGSHPRRGIFRHAALLQQLLACSHLHYATTGGGDVREKIGARNC